MKWFRFQAVIQDQLGPFIQIRETAIDDVSFNRVASFQNHRPSSKRGSPSFVANFPTCCNQTWFAQLKLLKMRDSGPVNDEVKWGWFQWARFQMNHVVTAKIYSGLGEAAIFINDLDPFRQRYEHIFLEMGIGQEVIKAHPHIRQMCLRYASEDLMFRTPLYEIQKFDPFMMYDGYVPTDRCDEVCFYPTVYLDKLKWKPQSVLQFAGETQASFQEIMDPDTYKPIVESLYHTRYFSYDQIQARRILWATSSNRMIDPGNEKVSCAVKEVRVQAREKMSDFLKFQYGPCACSDSSNYANTITDCPSHYSDELQMADMACGYAEELFRKYGGEVHKLCDHFKRVFFNGRLVE